MTYRFREKHHTIHSISTGCCPCLLLAIFPDQCLYLRVPPIILTWRQLPYTVNNKLDVTNPPVRVWLDGKVIEPPYCILFEFVQAHHLIRQLLFLLVWKEVWYDNRLVIVPVRAAVGANAFPQLVHELRQMIRYRAGRLKIWRIQTGINRVIVAAIWNNDVLAGQRCILSMQASANIRRSVYGIASDIRERDDCKCGAYGKSK